MAARYRQVNRQDAERIITEYLKPVFGFALKRCKSIPDAEDLSQEIVMKAFRALLARDDIGDTGKFIWTVAHNALSNYYRDAAKGMTGVSLDEVAEVLVDPGAEIGPDDSADSIRSLQREIAYLSGLQRRIVIAYYFENRRQADIARELGIPLGTVKWHLFEAKKELKRGMDTMRKSGELKFNPIRFDSIGTHGRAGTKATEDFLHSALSQNICYSVRNTAKTINEIADDLGVSPVYVETEAAYLEEYGFLQLQKDKYIVNFIISEPTAELLTMKDKMYKKVAGLFANELYDELMASGLLEDPAIACGQTDGPVLLTETPRADRNFLMWSLIPYIAAWSAEESENESKNITFEEVATIRPDGGQNIVMVTVLPDNLVLPDDYVYMSNWSGPMWNWNEDSERILWQIDSEWSDREVPGVHHSEKDKRVLSLYAREAKERLSKDEYAWLAEQGYVKTNGDYDGDFKASWQIVILENREIQEKLLAVGKRIREKYRLAFEEFVVPYRKAMLEAVPAHLRKVEEYELQSIFSTDGWFLVHCLQALLKSGKLKEPAEEQRKALTTIIAYR
ncbi:MAG TPA: hypothetical protein DCZ91_05645 [Lachnospiraceae bacterium]|nr:hypothetical protein [Lachnospiraceae bacterium]